MLCDGGGQMNFNALSFGTEKKSIYCLSSCCSSFNSVVKAGTTCWLYASQANFSPLHSTKFAFWWERIVINTENQNSFVYFRVDDDKNSIFIKVKVTKTLLHNKFRGSQKKEIKFEFVKVKLFLPQNVTPSISSTLLNHIKKIYLLA